MGKLDAYCLFGHRVVKRTNYWLILNINRRRCLSPFCRSRSRKCSPPKLHTTEAYYSQATGVSIKTIQGWGSSGRRGQVAWWTEKLRRSTGRGANCRIRPRRGLTILLVLITTHLAASKTIRQMDWTWDLKLYCLEVHYNGHTGTFFVMSQLYGLYLSHIMDYYNPFWFARSTWRYINGFWLVDWLNAWMSNWLIWIIFGLFFTIFAIF